MERVRSGLSQCVPASVLVLLPVLLLAGCGGTGKGVSEFSDQVVKGKVVLASGKPLTKGKVVFSPQQEPMMPLQGKLGDDGSFTLTTGGMAVGVSHGKFRVSVEPEGYVAGSRKVPKNLQFPAKYLNDQTTDLEATITTDTTELPTFELK